MTFMCFLFFFFQAEDGIRDLTVTGVQTCALPILIAAISPVAAGRSVCSFAAITASRAWAVIANRVQRCQEVQQRTRSEERRVGKECRSRWSPAHSKKKKVNMIQQPRHERSTATRT